ncbi:putative endopeptidase [Dokdonella fugitiva]|uniref:Putative endopeptidase n=1 Tax=Dokdonella fugitiva TaxID=328517 RepID=A0A839F1L4_9GAMM|nr:M13 family metallopeptidase [Dokdonella fugitiva]MBA8887000.1 putative endopeptidase [Dokdonella fugitiva]
MHKLPNRTLATAIFAALSTTAIAASTTPAFDVNELDAKIAPCADFNGFVNAKWVAANPIPADRTRWGAFDQLREHSLQTQRGIVEAAALGANKAAAGSIQQKIGWFYRSGMADGAIEKAGLAPVKPEIAKIDALKTPADIAAYINDASSRGQNGLFQIYTSPDFKNSKMQIAYVAQGGIGLPTSEYYSKPDYAELRTAYQAHVAKVLELAGDKADSAKKSAEQVLAFETRLAKASLVPVELRKPENQYHFVTLADADKANPNFSWTKFFAAQHADIQGGFSLSQPGFFAEVDKMVVDVPADEWRTYLRFHAIDSASPYLSKPFAEENFTFYNKTLNGQKEQEPRWKRVLSTVNESMGMALGQLYVDKTFPPESKKRALELVNNVSAALKARIEKLDWMSDATKQKAIEKWSTFLPKIGYPDKWREWSGLEVKSDDYYANVLAASKFNYDYEMAKAGKPTDRLEWGMTPQTVNAYYNPTDNTINFPAAILQPPFFDANADDAINYGGIGAVIGHEATHGYDDEGSQFDAQGNNANWWTKEDREKFDARTAKLVAQFNAYEPLPGKHVNGQLTLGENIADLGGLNVAYDALQMALKQNPAEAAKKIDGYTPDQRFFLNFARVWRGSILPKRQEVLLNADPHAPAKYRAIGAPSNMPAFAQAYSCKAGDAMVRGADTQVKIW